MKNTVLVIALFVTLNFLMQGKTGLIALFVIMLSVMLFLFNNIRHYLRTRKGIFANGKVINYRKIPFGEKDSSNYEIEIAFTNPLNLNEYKQIFYVFLIHAPSTKNGYKVWVDNKDVSKSLLIKTNNVGWLVMMILALLVFGVLLFFFVKNIILIV